MKSVEFCYWLQGLFELTEIKSLDEKQTDLIKRHLQMVFKHEIDPSYPKEQQKDLNAIHKTGPDHLIMPQTPSSDFGNVLLRC